MHLHLSLEIPDPQTTGLVSLSSAFLRVYEDDPNDTNFIDIPKRKEPRTRVLFEMSMYGAKVDVETKRHGFFKTNRTSVISITCCVTNHCIQLMFDSNKIQMAFLEWNKYIKESEEILNSRINRLCHAQCNLLPASTRQTYIRRSLNYQRRMTPDTLSNEIEIH